MTDRTGTDQEQTGKPITGWDGERDVSTEQGGATSDQTRPLDPAAKPSTDLTGATDQAGSGQTSEPRLTQSDREVLDAAESKPAVTPWTAGEDAKPRE